AIGGYCVRQAWRKIPHYWAFAVIPIGFGLQQAAEGCVWIALAAGDERTARVGSAVFLFFAFAVWPLWFPLAAACAEPRPGRSRFLCVWAVLASGWLWFAYLPALASWDSLSVQIVGHSLHYRHGDDVMLGGPLLWPITAVYVL